jgi:hypothetical protein
VCPTNDQILIDSTQKLVDISWLFCVLLWKTSSHLKPSKIKKQGMLKRDFLYANALHYV